MAKDTVESTTIEFYTTTGDTVTVKLSEGIVQYKTNVTLKSEEVEYTSDENELVSMTLPETDNMEGEVYYIFDFGNGIKYRAKVPYSAGTINFWDLNLEKNISKSFNPLKDFSE